MVFDHRQERWLILGASGWFGRTIQTMANGRAKVLGISGSAPGFLRWNLRLIEDFAPTHVFNCAFLTKEKLEKVGLEEYVRTNESLIRQFQAAASLLSCRFAMVFSSGSIVSDPEHPYSLLKQIEEEVCRSLANESRGSIILRTYSVSGPFMQRVSDYAFGDLLRQALSERAVIQVRAPGEVWRRYVDAEDSVGVAISNFRMGECRIIETGGELIELGNLAERIAAMTGSSVLEREISAPTSIYASDNVSWTRACEEIEYLPLNLDQQIQRTLAGCNLFSN